MRQYGQDGSCRVCGMLEGDHKPGNASCFNFPKGQEAAANDDPAILDAIRTGFWNTAILTQDRFEAINDAVLSRVQRWPDPIDPDEREAFARLCAKNFSVIDALFGNRLQVEYDGRRMATPNLGLVIPGLADHGWASDIAENFLRIDAAIKAVARPTSEGGWSVQWLDSKGDWHEVNPCMDKVRATELFDNQLRYRPATERFRLVRVQTLVVEEGGGGDR